MAIPFNFYLNKLKVPKRLKTKVVLSSVAIGLFISISLSQRAFDKTNLEYFPFYDWRLGFHEVPYIKRIYSLEVLQINGARLKEPMSLKSFLRLHPGPWIQTLDYKKVNFLAATLLEGRRSEEVLHARSLLETRLFRNRQIKSATYRAFVAEFDPLQAYSGKKTETTRTLGQFEFEDRGL